jgi:C1A family cysteine protease
MKRLGIKCIALVALCMVLVILGIALPNEMAKSAVEYEQHELSQLYQSNGENPCTIMHPSAETLRKWMEDYQNAPLANIDVDLRDRIGDRASYSLLSHLEYTPSERDQGYCGNCWVWAGTGVMEIALDVQNGIKDRLSIQYLNSNYNSGSGSNWACCGGSCTALANFYSGMGQAIPWSNTNAEWGDYSQQCSDGSTSVPAGTIDTTLNYLIDSIAQLRIPTTPYDGVTDQATAIANIKNILDQNQAIYFSFTLATSADWTNFFNFWNNQSEDVIWNPDYSCGHTYSTGGGGHGVLCVGYNDDDPDNAYWIMVNSWGTTSGRPNGIFHLDMDMDYFCYYYNPYPAGYYSFMWQTLDMTYDIWESYSDDDPLTRCDDFQSSQDEHTVYMYGTGFTASHQYRVAYYDGSNSNVATEDKDSDSSGNLLSEHTFKETPPADAPGTWHVIICEIDKDPPTTYNSDWPDTLASDNFTVQSSAIPEFPTVWAVIVALALSVGVYLWLRRRMSPVRA